MKKNLTTSLLLTMVLCIAVPTVSYAATAGVQMRRGMPGQTYDESTEGPTPRFSYTDRVTVLIGFDGKTADCGVTILVKDNATKVTGTLTLQKKSSSGSYSNVKSWNVKEEGGDLIFVDSYDVSSTGEYRLSFSGKVYSGTAYENISASISGTCD